MKNLFYSTKDKTLFLIPDDEEDKDIEKVKASFIQVCTKIDIEDKHIQIGHAESIIPENPLEKKILFIANIESQIGVKLENWTMHEWLKFKGFYLNCG